MQLLNEMLTLLENYRAASASRAYHGDWSILPATMALYNRRTVDLVDACAEWKNEDNTILICTKNDNGKKRICFISSSGDGMSHYEKSIGKTYSAYHDQTGGSKGNYTIINVVVLKDGEIVKKANEEGLKAKASLCVFK